MAGRVGSLGHLEVFHFQVEGLASNAFLIKVVWILHWMNSEPLNGSHWPASDSCCNKNYPIAIKRLIIKPREGKSMLIRHRLQNTRYFLFHICLSMYFEFPSTYLWVWVLSHCSLVKNGGRGSGSELEWGNTKAWTSHSLSASHFLHLWKQEPTR